MTLLDFATGTVPGMVWGRHANKLIAEIERFIAAGLIEAHEPNPCPIGSRWHLTVKGQVEAGLPVVDRSRWPYLAGVIARRNGLSRNWHELTGAGGGFDLSRDGGKLVVDSDCWRQWVAGWDEGSK